MRYKVKTYKTSKGIFKVRLVPWSKVNQNYIWLFSFGCSKSKRQLNDWLNKRPNKRAKKLSGQISGTSGLLPHGFAIRQLRTWIQELPLGDSIFFACESKEKIKQFNSYVKWFTKYEASDWHVDHDLLLFHYIKQ